jgi:molybdenum cofactor biosynthesis protein B
MHDYAKLRLKFSILTISDTRTEKTDESGRILFEEISREHEVVERRIVKDDGHAIQVAICELAKSSDIVVTTGGTGVSRRDNTVAAVKPLLSRELPGFGEIFRALSFEEIGSASYLSGALAGIKGDSAIFCLPGSPAACRLGVRLVLEQASHLIHMLRD